MLIRSKHHFYTFTIAKQRSQMPRHKWAFPNLQAASMLIHFSPNFAPCKIDQCLQVCGQPTLKDGNSLKRQDSDSYPHWQKKALSTSLQHVNAMTREHLEKGKLTLVFCYFMYSVLQFLHFL